MNQNDLQNLMNAQQQAYQQAADVSMHFKFLVYSTHLAIIICAIFSVFIFWKLCQIKTLLQSVHGDPARQSGSTAPETSPSVDSPQTGLEDDDSRFRPR